VISVKNGLKSRPTFAYLLPQRDKAALYLAGRAFAQLENYFRQAG